MTTKIYTKTGDKGKTSLLGGQRVNKFDLRVETYGVVDEVNSAIGLAASFCHKQKALSKKFNWRELELIQADLFSIGSALAALNNPQLPQLKCRIRRLEGMIDEQTENLPDLNNFILPGGSLAGAQLHLARTVCRRAERRVTELRRQTKIDELIISYLNRLSDFLFTAARYVNHLEKKKETIWRS